MFGASGIVGGLLVFYLLDTMNKLAPVRQSTPWRGWRKATGSFSMGARSVGQWQMLGAHIKFFAPFLHKAALIECVHECISMTPLSCQIGRAHV